MGDISQFETIKTDRLYIKVAEQLRTLIDNGVFKVGDRFPAERALADKLGVSRPTIREAMIALELSGLIEIRTGSGIYVAEKKEPVTMDPVSHGIGPFEILEMRYFLEPEICALAAARISDEQISYLQSIIEKIEDPDIDDETFEALDGELHAAIAEASQNTAMQASIKWLWKLRIESVFKQCTLEAIKQQGHCIDEHKRIVSAIAQKNPEKARAAMKAHLDNATTTIDIKF